MEPLLSLLLACSLHLDDPLLLGVIDAFSAGNPWTVQNVALAVDDELLGLDLPPSTGAEARAAVARIEAAGGSPVVGLLPLRPAWLAELDKPAEALFDPCQAIEVASSKISELDHRCRQRGPAPNARARRACTLDAYGASVGLPALRRVVMLNLDRTAQVPTETPDESTIFSTGGIFFDGGDR